MQLEQLDLPGGGLLTVYLRDCVETMPQAMERPLVLVVPGGGYSHVSAREGDPVALQFAAAGYHTAVLRYAVGDDAAHGLPLRQLAAAIGLVRQHAAAWHVQPDKIAVCGFSAGGHLALSGAVLAVPGLPDPPRPDAVILGYPVITAGQYAHRDSFVRWPGRTPRRSRRSRWRTRSRPTHRRSSSGIPWRTGPSRWRTRCCCSRPCGGRAWPARRISSSRGSTAPASAPPRWTPPTGTAPAG